MTAIILSFGAFISTIAGGVFALRFQSHLGAIVAFVAGVLLGVVAFDIVPEIFSLAHESRSDPLIGMACLAAGLMMFSAFQIWGTRHLTGVGVASNTSRLGLVSALAMSGHSLMDGVSIGLAFHISPTVGGLVALAVITHDFCDGLNTVGVMLIHGNSPHNARLLLMLDAVAPIAGVLLTLQLKLPIAFTIVYLGFFGGFLLFVATSTAAHSIASNARRKAPVVTFLLTLIGSALVWVVVCAGA